MTELQRLSHEDGGVAAQCLLDAVSAPETHTDEEHARRLTGALLLAEGLAELRAIRKLLTPPRD